MPCYVSSHLCCNLSQSHNRIRRWRKKKKLWESQILTLLTFKSGTSHTHHTHAHTNIHIQYLVVHSDSAHLWAEHLSHPQTTTEPIIHSSIHPSILAHLPSSLHQVQNNTDDKNIFPVFAHALLMSQLPGCFILYYKLLFSSINKPAFDFRTLQC